MATETPPWETNATPPWEDPKVAIKAPAGIDPNAPGGFNYGGKNTKIAPDTALGEDFWSDLYTDASRPAVPLPKFQVQPDDSKHVAVAKSLANLVVGLPEFVESPLGVATAAAGGVIPRSVAATFLGTTGKQVVDQAKQTGADWDQMTDAQKAAALTDIGGQTLFAGLMAHGAGGKLADAVDTRINPAGMLAREIGRTDPKFNSETPPTPIIADGPVATPPSVSPDLLQGLQTAMRQNQLSPASGKIPNSKPTAPQAEPATAASPSPMPEPAATLQAQVAATRDPQSPKAVTLVTPGEAAPADHGLTPVETAQGTALVNPAKIDPAQAKAVFDAGGGGQLLGMSTDAKPDLTTGEPLVTVQTKTADGTPVQEEVATGQTLAAAIAAGKQLAPEGTVEIKTPQDVIAERQAALQSESLLPVEVTDKDIAAMRDTAMERAPDVLDDIEQVAGGPVQFDPAQFGNVVADARQATLKNGRATAATKRLDARIHTTDGTPADEVLKGLAEQNPKYANWTGDDLAEAITSATAAREKSGSDAAARVLAEQQKRDQLFNEANAARYGTVSLPAEQLFLGDTLRFRGQDMRVTGFVTDAETGRPSHVELTGAYGKQTIPAGEAVHFDAGSLNAPAARGDMTPWQRREQVRTAAPVTVDSTPLGDPKAKDFAVKAKAEYRALKPATNLIDGHTVQFVMSGAKKLSSHRADARTLQIIPGLHDLMQHAVPLFAESDRMGEKGTGWHVYGARATLDGKPVMVKLVVREESKGKYTLDYFDDGSISNEEHFIKPDGQLADPLSMQGQADRRLDRDKLYQWWHDVKPDATDINSGALGRFGMGGAKPGEFTNSPQTPTGIKNAIVDQERAKRGLPAAMDAGRKSFGQSWDEAMSKVDKDPSVTDNLVAELKQQPRAVTDVEDALLLQRQVELQNDYGRVTRELAQAYDDAKQFPNRLDAVEELKLQAAALSDKLQELYDVNKSVGTETGRGLAARKMLAYENYTLASMETQLRAAKGGGQLTDAEREQITTLNQRIAETQKQFEDYQKQVEEERRQRQASEEIDARIEQVKNQPGYDRQVQSLADRIVAALSKEADAARVRMKERLKRFNAGIDPTMLSDLAIIGAEHIAKGAVDFGRWSKAMVSEFGDHIVPWLNQAWAKANNRVDTAVDRLANGKQSIEVKQRVRNTDVSGQRENIIAGLKQAKADGADMVAQGAYIRRLAENFVRAGVTEREALINAVHGVLKDTIDPEMTRREAMDAISGYGQWKPLDADAVKAKVRDLRGQMQQVAKLEDIQSKQPLLKTGVERRTPSDAERRLVQQVNEAKRRFGVITTDPARQLKGALDAIKKRLTNQISDLEYQISTRQRIVPERTKTPYDAEGKLLQLRRDELKQQLDELVPRPGLTDAQRAEIAKRALQRSITDLELRLKTGDISLRSSKPEVNTPELEALRARRNELRAQYQELVDTLAPERREQAQLSALKSRLASSTADYLARTAKGDFTVKPRQSPRLDAEAIRLKMENERAKNEFERAKIAARLAQRTSFEKAAATFLKWRRGFLLSGPVTLAKLTSAALQRLSFTPIEEAVGAGIGRIIPRVAENAPREGYFNSKAEAKALTEGFMKGLLDSWNVLRTGKSEMDYLYGKNKDGAVGEHDVEPRSVIDFFGQLHGALKAPVKRAEFTRSFEKRSAFYISKGVDVSDPMVQTRIAVEAYKDANRSIFLQDNRVVTAYKMALAALEAKNKTTDKTPLSGKVGALVARTMLPIIRVPTNIVAETLQYATGTVTGSARLGWALHNGIATLRPEEADLIMRDLKKGSLGAALLTAGYLMPNLVGGYYQPGQKRAAGDVKAGTLRIAGWNVPTFLLHNPLLETLQIGATIRRVADSKMKRSDQAPQGLAPGILAGALGLTEEVPFVWEMAHIEKLMSPTERGQYVNTLVKSIAIPQALQWLASTTDRDAGGNTIPRRPEGLMQNLQSGIPGMRQNLPLRINADTKAFLAPSAKRSHPKGFSSPAARAAWEQADLKAILNSSGATNPALLRAMGN